MLTEIAHFINSHFLGIMKFSKYLEVSVLYTIRLNIFINLTKYVNLMAMRIA